MKKYLISTIITSLICFLGVVAIIQPTNAASLKDASKILNSSATGAGFTPKVTVDEATLAAGIGSIINAFLGLVGAIATLYVIYGGFMWITAGGNTEQVGKAKKFVINASLGLIISSAAYLIIALVLKLSVDATG